MKEVVINTLIWIGFLIVAFCFVIWTESEKLNYLLDRIVFGPTATFVGLSVAVTGIFLTSVNTINLNIYKVFKVNEGVFSESDIKAIREGLSAIVDELKSNTMFIILAYAGILLIYFLRDADIPYLIWLIDHESFSEVNILNSVILSICFLIYFGIYDSIQVVFKIVNFFRFVKDE